MTDWEHDDELRAALLAELVAQMPGEAQPGDITAADLAKAAGISIYAAQYRLEALERDGALKSVKVRIPGNRVAVRVWRKP